MVLVLKDSALNGEYRLARVKQVYPDSSDTVRKVRIAYKNYKVGEKLGVFWCKRPRVQQASTAFSLDRASRLRRSG